MRRATWGGALAVGVTLLLATYVLFNVRVVRELRREAARSGRMYAEVYQALADTAADPVAALIELSRLIRESGVPVVVTDASGRPASVANTAFDDRIDDPRLLVLIERLDRQNPPIVESGVGTVHFGHTALVQGLRVIPIALVSITALVLLAGVYVLRTRERADREKVWAGMARESAHQLGTPLSSLGGWVELLEEQDRDPLLSSAIVHMRNDLDRLERVAHRFERIGRPPRREPVDVGELVDRVAAYFRARVPTLAHPVQIASGHGEERIVVHGDTVLLEWALEALMKNAIDALAGRGGRIYVTAERTGPGVRIRVADDGPGITRDLRTRIFDPGFSTKEAGWGVGLSLARRIVEEAHGGRLTLVPSAKGATFDAILPG